MKSNARVPATFIPRDFAMSLGIFSSRISKIRVQLSGEHYGLGLSNLDLPHEDLNAQSVVYVLNLYPFCFSHFSGARAASTLLDYLYPYGSGDDNLAEQLP